MDNIRHYTSTSILIAIAIATGFLLTFLHWIGACTEACAAVHHYRFFGLPFEIVGFLYFIILAAVFVFSFRNIYFFLLLGLLLAAGFGAELMFIFVQKFIIGKWCPFCLGIAAAVIIASIAWGKEAWDYLQRQIAQGNRQNILKSMKVEFATLFFLLLGFVIALFGISKHEESEATEMALQQYVIFGNKKSPVEIYVFTSWICPACHRFEPTLERIIPELLKQAKVVFVDSGVDDKTLNYLPFNLSFILNNKEKYLELRHMLHDLSETSDEPSDEEVGKAAAPLGVHYKEINYATVAAAIEYYKELVQNLKISALPTIVVLNRETEKQGKLSGTSITLEQIQEIIDGISK